MFSAELLWMVRSLDKRLPVRISAGACILLALMLLLLPIDWLLAAILAAMFHEASHLLAVMLFGGRVCYVKITASGVRMDSTPVSGIGQVVCSLAGPIGGLLLLLFAKWIPRVALCAAVQSIWNLLPIYPLDGGRALRSVIVLLFSVRNADTLCKIVESVCIASLVALGIYGSIFLHLGLLPLLPGVISLVNGKCGKTPCKQRLKRVQ